MSVDDVIHLMGQIDGFNQRMIDDYGCRLTDSNVNGTVLASCDLVELKPVLQMAFGDWVLFRSLVEYLRYSERSAEPSEGELSPPMDVFVRSAADAPDSAATDKSKKATSEVTVSSVSNTDAGVSRSSPTLKDPPNSDVTDGAMERPPLNRQDSFVSEVLMESETLRGFIQASVVGSDSDGAASDDDDEPQRPITTIPEESVAAVSRNTSGSSLGHAVVRRVSVDSGPVDRAFSVGPDHDSGDSDSEVERVSRKSSIRQNALVEMEVAAADDRRKKHHHHPASKPPPPAKHPLDRSSLKNAADKSKSASKLERGAGAGGNEHSVPLMSQYFPLAFDRGTPSSQTTSFVSPKASRQVSGSNSHHSDVGGVSDDASYAPRCQAALSSGHAPPTSSSASNHVQSSDPAAKTAIADSSEVGVEPDSVKFFIVDESDLSPKAIMVEMDARSVCGATTESTSC